MTLTASPAPAAPDTGVVLAADADTGLTYTWYDVSPDVIDAGPRRRGHETSLLTVHHGPHRVGALRVGHTTAELTDTVFWRPLAFADLTHGWCLGLSRPDRGKDPAKLWVDAHLFAREIPASLTAAGYRGRTTSLTRDLAPADPRVLEADLAALEGPLRAAQDTWFAYYRVPYVAYARVDGPGDPTPPGHPGPVRGTGVGTRMYTLAATQLATTGRVLRASDTQSPEARALWDRLTSRHPHLVTEITLTLPGAGEPCTYRALDAR